jgi:hypothetical protein
LTCSISEKDEKAAYSLLHRLAFISDADVSGEAELCKNLFKKPVAAMRRYNMEISDKTQTSQFRKFRGSQTS